MQKQQLTRPGWYVVLRRFIVAMGVVSFVPMILGLFGLVPESGLGLASPVVITWLMLIAGCTLEVVVRVQAFRRVRRDIARRSAAA